MCIDNKNIINSAIEETIGKAYPIWLNNVMENQYIEAVQLFDISSPKHALIQICSDTGYSFYINGIFKGAGQWCTFPDKKAYDEYDITDLLRDGKNVLKVIAYHQGTDSSTYCHGQAALVFALNIDGKEFYSGIDTMIREHPHYQSGSMEMITCQLGYSFCYDASKKGNRWQRASILKDYSPKYFKRPVKRLVYDKTVTGKIKTQGFLLRTLDGTTAKQMQSDFLSFRKYVDVFNGTTVKKQECGVYFVIDLGENLAGYFTMSLDAPKGTVIDIGYGEHLDDLRVRTEIDGRNFAARYITDEGKQNFTEHFRRFGCRFIEIHITEMTGNINFEKIGLIPAWYPLSREAEVKCGDYLFDKLYKVCIKTLKMCMHEHYEDCPCREQALYAYDSYVQMLCGYYAFGEYEFARASLQLLADSQCENGVLRITAPGNAPITIPIFSLAWIMSLEKYVLFSGDVEFGKEMLANGKKILDFFEIKDGLVINKTEPEYWNFIEWSDGLDGAGNNSVVSDAPTCFYYILAVEAYDRLCTYCGKAPYEENIGYIKSRILEEFFDSKNNVYITRKGDVRIHELTQAFAVLADMPNSDKIVGALANKGNMLIKTTLSTSMFKYDALLKYGDVYAEFVIDDMAEIYGDMLFQGADTLWETAEGAKAFDNAGSLCHAWSAVPVYILFRYYIGFKPEEPGFKRFSVNPLKSERLSRLEAQLLMPNEKIEFWKNH